MVTKRIRLDSLQGSLDLPVDVFLCFASFESRCISVAENTANLDIKQRYVLRSLENKEHTEDNARKLMEIVGPKAQIIELSSDTPFLTAQGIFNLLNDARVRGLNSYLVDITTFTHEALLILIRAIDIFKNPNEMFRFVYTTADEYSLGESDDHKWLSKGCKNIRSVLGYPGEIVPNRKVHLIVLVGFEVERAHSLVEDYEPNILSLGYGEKHTSEKHEAPMKRFYEMLKDLEASQGNVYDFRFSCLDPVEALNAIENQVWKFKDYNSVIASMNNKLSSVGAALAALRNPKIQLCYAQPESYNFLNYSTPGADCTIFDLDVFLDV
jgi:hypothetical protein